MHCPLKPGLTDVVKLHKNFFTAIGSMLFNISLIITLITNRTFNLDHWFRIITNGHYFWYVFWSTFTTGCMYFNDMFFI